MSHARFIYVFIIVARWAAIETSMTQRTINENVASDNQEFSWSFAGYLSFFFSAPHFVIIYCAATLKLCDYILAAFRIIIY